MSINAIIVDDETPGRNRIRQLLSKVDDFCIVGEFNNGVEAIKFLEKESPDVVFLDIKMPGMDGFEVCRNLPRQRGPIIVFITAFDRYAIDAFEVKAIDYLLKPFDEDRFQKALESVRERYRSRSLPSPTDFNFFEFIEELKRSNKQPDRLAFRADGKVVFVRPGDIDFIESDGNYLGVFGPTPKLYVRETLAGMETLLPKDRFIRINRSVLVNLDQIREVEPSLYGDGIVHLRNGTKLSLSRKYKDRIEELLRH